jgi:hypothetical protein
MFDVHNLVLGANYSFQGPGGSGTASIAIQGEDMSITVDGRYDIIGFDPR